MIRFVASDLDGTLLQKGNREITDGMFDIIESLRKRDIVFAAASGRQYANLRNLFYKVQNDIMYICENGALVMYRDKVITKTPMDRNIGLEIMRDIHDTDDLEILLSGVNTSYLMPKSDEYIYQMRDVVKNNVTVVEDITQVSEDFLKISVYAKRGIDEYVSFFADKYSDVVSTAVSGQCWLDFTDIHVNKGTAIDAICKDMHYDRNEMMAFGDNYNDFDMFDRVEYSYAMNGASSDVKKRAKYSADTVEEVLEKLINKTGGN